jgi:hypothetical protein
MPVIDARPQGVELRAYAGDTFSFKITTDVDYSEYTWTGQVRSDHPDPIVDGTFEFSDPIQVADKWEVVATLPADTTQALADLIPETPPVTPTIVNIGGKTSTPTAVQTYKGVWDIQVKLDDVVKTLVQGTIFVDEDVTRSV